MTSHNIYIPHNFFFFVCDFLLAKLKCLQVHSGGSCHVSSNFKVSYKILITNRLLIRLINEL